MTPLPHRIAVLGVPGSEVNELMQALRTALATQTDPWHISDEIHPDSGSGCLTLLLGLSLSPAKTDVALDRKLRQQLHTQGLPYRVIYGTDPATRLANALHALGQPATDSPSVQARAQAQFDLNRGRTPWSCEKCSDPDCEHRLFTGLLRRQTD